MSEPTTIVHMLRNSALRYPDSDAVVYAGLTVNYAQLWKSITNVANFLRSNGLARGDRVTLLMENSPEYIVAYYGVIMAGGVVVALNTSAKCKDLSVWIRHSDPRWLIADGNHPELKELLRTDIPDVNIALNCKLDAFTDDGTVNFNDMINSNQPRQDDILIDDINQLASIIYTSGTTGRPKGVMLSHKNLAANITSITQYLELSHKDRIVNVLPFYYSYGNSVLHTHMSVGGTLILENSLAFPQKILGLLEQEKATGFSGVPSTYALLMNRTKFTNFNLSSLRYMTQAGGPMAPANIKRVIEELPEVQFYVMYGQTEATARLSYLPPVKLWEKMGSIGIPIPGVKIEIRDEQDKKTMPGVTGQICVKGDNVMQGYWKDVDETNKVLRDNWLYTGDLAHYDTDEYIYIDGRSSDMIKSGAHRISPKEIEEVIQELDEILEVAVVGVADEMMGQLLKAVIVVKHGYEVNKTKILQHCRRNLAMYKIPKYVEFKDQLPKTASGKIRRFLLQE